MYKIECLTQMDAEFNQHNAVCDPYGGACNPVDINNKSDS